MQDAALLGPAVGRDPVRRGLARLYDFLPRGNMLDDAEWHRRHRLLEWVLLLHVPALVGIGLALGRPLTAVGAAVVAPLVCVMLGHVVRHRRWASFFVTGGLVFSSAALVLLTRGTIEAHFHFFIIIGFIALYQDWVPFLWNVTFTVLSHGIGTAWLGGSVIFNHPAAQANPWLWSFIHGVAVLTACVGMVIFWRITEEEQEGRKELSLQLVTADAEAEIGRRQFTSDLLVNLARRNQSMLYRQLDIINQLEDKERDPDALAGLFKIDHLATRIRRNAESLLVLAGEQPPRTWPAPVELRDVVRAAIAETEDLDRVVFAVDDRVSVMGSSVADLTHLIAELTENAVRFSPPESVVTIRARPNRRVEGGHLLTVEDWGVGMPPAELAEANELLAHPREVDVAVAQRLGFHVVSRLAVRHGIGVSLTATPGAGITAVAVLPAALFTPARPAPAPARPAPAPGRPAPTDTARLPVAGHLGNPAHPAPVPTEIASGQALPPEVVRPGGRPQPIGAEASGAPGPVPGRAQAARGTDSRPAGPWSGWWMPEHLGGGGGAAGADSPVPAVNGADSPGAAVNGADSPVRSGNEHGRAAGVDRGGATATPSATAAAGPGAGVSEVPAPHAGEPAAPAAPPAAPPTAPGAPPSPDPAARPLTALPDPHARERPPSAPAPRGPQPGRGERTLRRRVPQTHLAPELRLAANGLTDTAAPAAADTAASALSRYQASRRAAQAVVETPDAPQNGEGARR